MVDVRISSIAEHLFGKSTQPFKSKIIAYKNASLFFAPRELESIVPQMEFSLTAVLLSLILLLNVRHEKNANGRNKHQLETKVLWKADCPIWKDSTRFDQSILHYVHHNHYIHKIRPEISYNKIEWSVDPMHSMIEWELLWKKGTPKVLSKSISRMPMGSLAGN